MPVSDTAAELVAASVGAFVTAMAGTEDPELSRAVADLVRPLQLHAGDTLLSKGDESDAAYFVVTGRLQVVTDDGTPARRLGRGEIVGEMGVLGGGKRNATVRADRDSILARLPKDDFEQLAMQYPGFGLGVARVVTRRLAHPRPPDTVVRTITLAVTHPDIDARHLSAKLLQTMERAGSAIHVSGPSVDAQLGTPGASHEPPGTLSWMHTADLLDTLEARHRSVLLEADPEPNPWSTTALRHADRTLIVMSAEPDPAEDAAVRALSEAAGPAGHAGKWIVTVWPEDNGRPTGAAALAERYGAERVLHIRAGSASDIARLARLATGTGTGLVIGGGGARGFAALGVYRALTDLGVEIDAVAGASIGGILGAAIADGIDPEQLIRESEKAFRKVLDYTLPLVSLVKGARITREITSRFGASDIEDLVLPFLCVSTNLTTSRQVVHDRGSVTRATRAGLAIPGVIPPIPDNGNLLVDGGVLDNLPVDHLRATGLVDTVIAVDVAPPLGPRAKEDFGLSVSGWRALRSKLRRRRRFPGVSALILRSMLVGSMRERDRLVAEGYTDLYLDLDLRGISLLAFDDVRPVAEAGYDAARPRIEAWLAETTGNGAG
jgi:predicted acylesterase/phospholipase RssA